MTYWLSTLWTPIVIHDTTFPFLKKSTKTKWSQIQFDPFNPIKIQSDFMNTHKNACEKFFSNFYHTHFSILFVLQSYLNLETRMYILWYKKSSLIFSSPSFSLSLKIISNKYVQKCHIRKQKNEINNNILEVQRDNSI